MVSHEEDVRVGELAADAVAFLVVERETPILRIVSNSIVVAEGILTGPLQMAFLQ